MDSGDETAGEGEAPPPGGGERPEPQPGRPRPVNLAIVAGGAILLGLVALSLYRRTAQAPAEPSGAAAGQDPGAASPAATEGQAQGTLITAVAMNLTPEASIIAERYRCVCSCNDPLSVCTCTLTPGSIDMKKYVQELVSQKKTAGEVDEAMVARYGEAVLLSNAPAPSGQPAPARPAAPAGPPVRSRKP